MPGIFTNMADSDEEYIQDLSNDEVEAHQVTRGAGPGTRASGKSVRRGQQGWEVTRTWENVVEGADGTISSTVEGLLEAGKRKRLLKDTTPVQRGIIRHLILIIDLSSAMSEKDLLPTRYLLTLRYAQDFITEFFEQNPISQLGIIGMRDGLAVRISDISGNPNDHIGPLQALRTQEPKGHASLQNALDMARAALFHAPSHGTREVLLIFGSLLSSDPGDIFSTITALVASAITTTVVGLAAQVAICRTLVARTNPGVPADEAYGVALNEQHFRDLVMHVTTPPITSRTSQPQTNQRGQGEAAEEGDNESSKSSLLMMGFPSRIVEPARSLCACHSRPTRGGYLCSRCGSKVCALPSACPACGLTLILSTHLARSYHHLFPLRNWRDLAWKHVAASLSASAQPPRRPHGPLDAPQLACFACLAPFPPLPPRELWAAHAASEAVTRRIREAGVSESGRYECGVCRRWFCADCDVFAHEVVHNCPGCQSREGVLQAGLPQGDGGAMDVDADGGAGAARG